MTLRSRMLVKRTLGSFLISSDAGLKTSRVFTAGGLQGKKGIRILK